MKKTKNSQQKAIDGSAHRIFHKVPRPSGDLEDGSPKAPGSQAYTKDYFAIDGHRSATLFAELLLPFVQALAQRECAAGKRTEVLNNTLDRLAIRIEKDGIPRNPKRTQGLATRIFRGARIDRGRKDFRAHARPAYNVPAEELDCLIHDDWAGNPERVATAKEERERQRQEVELLLREIPVHSAVVLRLLYSPEFNFDMQKVATELKLPVETVKRCVFEFFLRLRKRLGKRPSAMGKLAG